MLIGVYDERNMNERSRRRIFLVSFFVVVPIVYIFIFFDESLSGLLNRIGDR